MTLFSGDDGIALRVTSTLLPDQAGRDPASGENHIVPSRPAAIHFSIAFRSSVSSTMGFVM
jgi:hypothetical protein